MPSKEFIIAIDAGGTMTDCILVQPDGEFAVGKALSNREDEASSYLESVRDAASFLGLSSNDVHKSADSSVYTGTAILNTILTRSGAVVGLIVTRGFEHITVMEAGLTWVGEPQEHLLHQQLRRHTPPLVDPGNVIGVSERIAGNNMFPGRDVKPGEVLIPLNREEVRQAAERLITQGVEIIGIMFVNSYVNPNHELTAKEIVEEVARERGTRVDVVTSSEVAPVMKENYRVKSLIFQAHAAEKVRTQLKRVERAAQEEGLESPLYTLLSYGGAVTVDYPRLYETVISGPIGGLTGAQVVGNTLGIKNLVTADMGGTSFDVGLVVDHLIEVRRYADFARHRLATPMVAIDSVGSGAGSVVRVDQYKRLHVGPESAGYKVGLCYQYPDLTITDINVALGFVDPDYFLGGKIKLDRDRALAGLEERVARPLGLDPFFAGEGVLEVIHSQMRDLMRSMLLSKGYNPSEFTALCYGGAGPVHMRGFTEGVGLAEVITVPWAAAFSAYGAACAEHYQRYERSHVTLLPPGLSLEDKQGLAENINSGFRQLEERAIAELKDSGIDPKTVMFRYGVYARYIGQLESFDTPLNFRPRTVRDLDRIVDRFEEVYTKIYPEGARFPETGYAVTEIYIHAVVPRPRPELREHIVAGEKPDDSAFVGTRQVFYGGRWQQFDVWQMETLKAGNIVRGPAIIRDPMTTVVIPPKYEVAFDRFLVMHYRKATV
ncbi:hydantoinase/oxoprolinase family protein [Kyrpidia spormannii]|uniref:hydantoinase/oxoprolinase family protein n=1 Tax=Kyrpidia spormannii TaxID=2055160 RepID=UPI001E645D54|nr:hydantoinase/oxoprolinase family protein [Kyrpidia spormannii]